MFAVTQLTEEQEELSTCEMPQKKMATFADLRMEFSWSVMTI